MRTLALLQVEHNRNIISVKMMLVLVRSRFRAGFRVACALVVLPKLRLPEFDAFFEVCHVASDRRHPSAGLLVLESFSEGCACQSLSS